MQPQIQNTNTDNLERFKKSRERDDRQQPQLVMPMEEVEGDNTFGSLARQKAQEWGTVQEAAEPQSADSDSALAPLERAGGRSVAPEGYEQGAQQESMVGQKGTINTRFGERSGADIYSGGINYGVDIGVKRGTKVAAPPGEWVVVDAFADATVEGPENAQRGINNGYGNSVFIQNTQTGEKLRYSHLMTGGVYAKRGDRIKGGTVIGRTGATGNTAGQTGQHLDLEYYDPSGKIGDVLKTNYANNLM